MVDTVYELVQVFGISLPDTVRDELIKQNMLLGFVVVNVCLFVFFNRVPSCLSSMTLTKSACSCSLALESVLMTVGLLLKGQIPRLTSPSY